MVTMAQRIEALRTERNLSRPALSAALGFPKNAAEKFETGRQTPSQSQQEQLASYFGVTLAYLRGEVDVREEGQGTWLERAYAEEEPAPAPAVRKAAGPTVVQSSGRQPGRRRIHCAFEKSRFPVSDPLHGFGRAAVSGRAGAAGSGGKKGTIPLLSASAAPFFHSQTKDCAKRAVLRFSILRGIPKGKLPCGA